MPEEWLTSLVAGQSQTKKSHCGSTSGRRHSVPVENEKIGDFWSATMMATKTYIYL